MKNNKTIIIIAMVISSIILTDNLFSVNSNTLAYLTLKTEPGEHFDYALYISKYLKSIDIEVRIQVQEEVLYDNLVTSFNDSDLAILEIDQEVNCSYGDFLQVYSEEGILSDFGWERALPYCNQSEQLLKVINATDNELEKKELLNDWMIIVMDKILPVLPLFIPSGNQSIIFLVFNLRKPFVGGDDNYVFYNVPGKETYTKGVSIRKAICYSINREEINSKINSDCYAIYHRPVLLEILETDSFEIIYDYNEVKASEWLDAASWRPTQTPNYSGNRLNFLLTMLGGFLMGTITLEKKRRKRIST